ncbi:hypothetical protein OKW76_02070 [Sphingomonas sp. S1-29]|uniref:hypothetical protein n=1 Tax=Sphingomonas sp. S1-29 TaxID=2991074 RepID=UPI00223FB5AE|nr:hypothetical protein [Sphingomonas sp. S1-29]UZK69870.1 hypothetical protein OKW76_02070 [Sphingomonas sp. S1-29]
MREGEPVGADALLAQAAAHETHARATGTAAIRDFLAPDAARLDDRTRVALTTLLRTMIGTIGGDLHGHAIRLLTDRGETRSAGAIADIAVEDMFARVQAQLLRHAEVARELLDRVAMDLLAERLADGESGEPVRHIDHADRVVAQRAAALLAAESRRRTPVDQPPYATDLSAELHVRTVWATAAAIAATGEGGAALHRALADAGLRSLAAHDEGARLEAAAVRLASAIDAPTPDLPVLLEQALGNRRVALFIALVAHGLRIAFEDVRTVVVQPGDVRLWLALRALGLPRATIARIGYMLSEADPRRDIETFADLLDPLAALAPEDALAALAPLKLPRDYRDALAAPGS